MTRRGEPSLSLYSDQHSRTRPSRCRHFIRRRPSNNRR
jgi:hypothetical protein